MIPKRVVFEKFEPDTSFSILKRRQKRAYASGSALANHAKVCHKGIFDPLCAACRELKEKSKS